MKALLEFAASLSSSTVHRLAQLEQLFDDWLDRALVGRIPAEVQSFSLDIGERELGYVVELNGASDFDPNHTLWIWSEIWQPSSAAKLRLPGALCGPHPGNCRRKVGVELKRYLREGKQRHKLLAARGVAVGLIDGSHEIVYQNASWSYPVRRLVG